MVQYGLLAITMVVVVANTKLLMMQMSWNSYGGMCDEWVLSHASSDSFISSYWNAMSPRNSVDSSSHWDQNYWLVISVCGRCVDLLFYVNICLRQYDTLPWQIVQEQSILHTDKYLIQNRSMSIIDIVADSMPHLDAIAFID